MVVVNRRLGCNDSGNPTLAIALIIFQLQLVNSQRILEHLFGKEEN